MASSCDVRRDGVATVTANDWVGLGVAAQVGELLRELQRERSASDDLRARLDRDGSSSAAAAAAAAAEIARSMPTPAMLFFVFTLESECNEPWVCVCVCGRAGCGVMSRG